jgi:hypothetical protein
VRGLFTDLNTGRNVGTLSIEAASREIKGTTRP